MYSKLITYIVSVHVYIFRHRERQKVKKEKLKADNEAKDFSQFTGELYYIMIHI